MAFWNLNVHMQEAVKMSDNLSRNKITTTPKIDPSVDTNHHQRSKRFFKLADDWYFITRENINLGPYRSYEQAAQAAATFVDFIEVAPARVVDVFVGKTA